MTNFLAPEAEAELAEAAGFYALSVLAGVRQAKGDARA